MNEALQRLLPKERRGSKPRCHWLTHGPREEVAERLISIVEPWASVTATDQWMPDGFANTAEPQLHLPTPLLSEDKRQALGHWWLPHDRQTARTPNFDLASTCTLGGVAGLILVEAKGHDTELNKEAAGRRLNSDASEGRRASHQTIGIAIEEARCGLSHATASPWSISRDTHYQMCNRFAWAWKLADLGIPVILVYLGFLRADEMKDRGAPFSDPSGWETLVRAHSAKLFPDQIWNHRWSVNEVPFIPLIRSVEQPLDPEVYR